MQERLTESGPDILAALRRAHTASVVEFTYTKKSGDKSHRRLVVQKLYEKRVLGFDLDSESVKSFTISGITELVSASPPEIDLAPLAEAVERLREESPQVVWLMDQIPKQPTLKQSEVYCVLDGVKNAVDWALAEASKLLGGIVVVPVETDEEPPL